MVETGLIEGIAFLETALDFVGLYKSVKDCAHGQGWKCGGAAEIVCDSQDGANVVYRQ